MAPGGRSDEPAPLKEMVASGSLSPIFLSTPAMDEMDRSPGLNLSLDSSVLALEGVVCNSACVPVRPVRGIVNDPLLLLLLPPFRSFFEMILCHWDP